MAKELVIYCDESVQQGPHYSNFYGGLLIKSTHLAGVIHRLESCRDELGLTGEVKWTAVTPSVEDRYRTLLDALFDEITAGRAKVRVMFRHNRHRVDLTEDQRRDGYVILYYQFIKWAFGLEHAGAAAERTRVRLMLDRMPANTEQRARFRGYLVALSRSPDMRRAGVHFAEDAIAEIDSRDHIAAQCLDLVLGAVAYRLNDLHKARPEGAAARGKRTLSKERVYKHLHARIAALHPNFNIGITTGIPNGPTDRWHQPYRHWCFVPKDAHLTDEGIKKARDR